MNEPSNSEASRFHRGRSDLSAAAGNAGCPGTREGAGRFFGHVRLRRINAWSQRGSQDADQKSLMVLRLAERSTLIDVAGESSRQLQSDSNCTKSLPAREDGNPGAQKDGLVR
jgi:hypothetical protein